MSSGIGVSSQKVGTNSKRFLQPPLMNSFDLFSSQEREEGQVSEEPIHELSNVEQRSYFESEPQLPDRLDIQNFLGKMREVAERQITPPKSGRSQRLEDQEIIVVEEENQVGSNLGGNESLILEHIEFGNDTHPENTPEWQEGRSKDEERKSKGDLNKKQAEEKTPDDKNQEEIKYVINLVPESPPWVNDNLSSSTPYDIESSGFKLTPNRNSKNTCIDRTEPIDPHPDRPNKSCIEQPIRYDEEAPPPTPRGKFSSLKTKNIQHILDKWNQEVYPRLENQYLDAPPRRGSADFQMERDAKFCHSGYEYQQTPNQSHHIEKIEASAQTATQTDISGEELLKNEGYLSEEIAQLRNRNQKLQEEVRTVRDALRSKEQELEIKSSQRQTQEQSEQEKRWGDESRKLSSRNRELQRMISIQNETIKQFEERQESLQKKLHKTVSYHTLSSTPDQRSPTFFGGEYQSLKLNKLQTFGLEDHTHEKCRREAEELQESIFDLQQQIAGIDIEVERRVRIISQAIHQELEQKASKEGLALRDELGKCKETVRGLECKLRDCEEQYRIKEREIGQRQFEVNRMYDQLVKEWKEIQRQSEMEKKQRHKTEVKFSNNFYSPKVNPKTRFDYDRSPTIEAEREDQTIPSNQYGYLSSKELKPSSVFSRDRLNYPKRTMEPCTNNSVSYLPPQDFSLSYRKGNPRLNETEKFSINFTRALGEENRWERREPMKTEFRQNGELSAINNKIQRLRKEINRELCSFQS